MVNRDELIEAYVGRLMDGFDTYTIEMLAMERLQESLITYSDEQLLDEISEYAPDLIGE